MLTLPKFDYFEPGTISEALSLLAQYDGEAKVIAGGMDLLVKMKQKALKPRYLVNIKLLSNLRDIRLDRKVLSIGALATFRDVETTEAIKQEFEILSRAANTMASPQVRNVGTIGGNLCNASPAADMAPPLIGLGAEVKIAGLKGERTIALEKFFIGPGKTVLTSDEILAEILVPAQAKHTGAAFLKFAHRMKDLAVASVAAVVTLDSRKSVCKEAKIVMGSVAPTVIRASSAEEMLKGRGLSEEALREAGELAAKESRPISDVRGSAEYRVELIKVLTKRALKSAFDRASGGGL